MHCFEGRIKCEPSNTSFILTSSKSSIFEWLAGSHLLLMIDGNNEIMLSMSSDSRSSIPLYQLLAMKLASIGGPYSESE